MVASSCVMTIMVLNYHHRLTDTHEMPDWVGNECHRTNCKSASGSGAVHISAMDAMAVENVLSGRENYWEVYTNAEEVLEMEDASLPHNVHPSNTNSPVLSNLCLTR